MFAYWPLWCLNTEPAEFECCRKLKSQLRTEGWNYHVVVVCLFVFLTKRFCFLNFIWMASWHVCDCAQFPLFLGVMPITGNKRSGERAMCWLYSDTFVLNCVYAQQSDLWPTIRFGRHCCLLSKLTSLISSKSCRDKEPIETYELTLGIKPFMQFKIVPVLSPSPCLAKAVHQ